MEKKKLRGLKPILIILVIAGVATAFLLNSEYSVRVDKPVLTPVETVQAFYKWYIEFKGHPLLSGAYKDSDLMSDEYKKTLEEIVEREGTHIVGIDPVLCSGGAPYDYEVIENEATDDEVSTTVHADYYGDIVDIEVGLIKEGRYWVVNNVTCPEPQNN